VAPSPARLAAAGDPGTGVQTSPYLAVALPPTMIAAMYMGLRAKSGRDLNPHARDLRIRNFQMEGHATKMLVRAH
jgi:hypothetical protein